MVDSLYRLFKATRNYRNPLSIAWARATGAPIVKVQDRKTGLVFHCRRGADTMMAETFHALIYEIPFAPIRPGDVVLDIGANHGFYSCWAAQQGATVHAFEPDPSTYKLLLQNIATNGMEGRIFPHQAAIAAETGDLSMYCTSQLGGGLSTIVPAFADKTGMEVTSQSKVHAYSMSDALKLCELSHVRICKMDCEGAENAILASLDSKTVNSFDAFVLEYHPQAYEMSQFMELLLSWEGHHLSKVVSSDRELANANLTIVREEIIRHWSGSNPAPEDHQRKIPTAPPQQQAVA
jgi:FkbM family methyltransferase